MPATDPTPYDSRPDTIEHIREVQRRLATAIANLTQRMIVHDASKLESPEREVFDEFTPKLKGSTYNSDEYYRFLEAMRPALNHHYANNRHHPEHFENGMSEMTLLDLLEMLCDWKAATMRHANGDLRKSIDQNQERFEYSNWFNRILLNTAIELGFCE